MEPVVITLVLLAIGIALSVPIGIAIGFATLVGVWYGDLPLEFFTQKFFNNFDSFPLMAVPFFIMAGDIMSHGSLSDSLLRLCRTTCGHLRGGLAHISIITALFYGALCGSAAATTAAVGGTMIPAMEKDKKSEGRSIHFVLVAGPGKVRTEAMTAAAAAELLKGFIL